MHMSCMCICRSNGGRPKFLPGDVVLVLHADPGQLEGVLVDGQSVHGRDLLRVGAQRGHIVLPMEKLTWIYFNLPT